MAVPTFNDYAGQMVAGGVKTSDPTLPINALEQSPLTTNLGNYNGLSAKVKDVFTRINPRFSSPLEKLITRWDEAYGAGMEQISFGYAPNKTITADTSCYPRGTPSPIVSQADYLNFGYNVTINLPDFLFNKYVLDEGQMANLASEYLSAPGRTIGYMRHLALTQLLSDVVDGTRSVASNTQSDGNGVSVTYDTPNVKGYAGKVEDTGIVMAGPTRGAPITAPTTSDALTIARLLESASADFGFVGDDYNKKGQTTFTEGQPWLVMEKKTLNALDNAFVDGNAVSNASYQIGPTTFRTYVSRFANLVETDAFADLPTNDSYGNKRLGGVLIDPYDPIIENVKVPESTESFRCVGQRATGYNYVYASIIAISQMSNSYAFLLNSQEA